MNENAGRRGYKVLSFCKKKYPVSPWVQLCAFPWLSLIRLDRFDFRT